MAYLLLDDGWRADRPVAASGGQRNAVFFARDHATGEPVVVKVAGGAPEGLATERRALLWAARHGVPVPTVRRSGRVRACTRPWPERLAGRPCLVLERLTGRRPGSPADWRLMGRALAALRDVPWAGSGLPVLRWDRFVRGHEELAAHLAGALPRASAAALRRTVLAAPPPARLPGPVLSHGDPGPGNFLVGGEGPGLLLDWETARVAPAGLDPARAAFLALLAPGSPVGPGNTGEAEAAEVWQGYLAGAARRPSPAEARWWMAVAAVQFVAFRHERRAADRALPWQDAVAAMVRMPPGLAAEPG